MKSVFSIAIICILTVSCKTISIPSSAVFSSSKYDSLQYKNYEQIEKQNYVKLITNNLLDKEITTISSNENIEINRHFLHVNDSTILEYLTFKPAQSSKRGLFFLGNQSTALNVFSELEKLALATNSEILVLNYRGYGNSTGNPDFKTSFGDNQFFYNELIKSNRNIDFAIGYSLGSVHATYLATENNIGQIVLLAPFSETKDIFQFFKKKGMKGIKVLFRPFIKLTAEAYLLDLSNSEKISSYKGKLLVMHALDDENLPFKMGKQVFEKCETSTKNFIELEDGGHIAPLKFVNLDKIIPYLK